MVKTQLKKLKIKKFRALNDVEIEFGEHITVICGKNGTSKSSILGIAAQIFSFEKDYVKDNFLSYHQIAGATFKSQYKDHFRISEKFDPSGSMEVDVELFDGYTNREATAELELSKRGSAPRPVVRKNTTVTIGNKSRNFTHPVIFLSLKRLFPITDREYKVNDFEYLEKHKKDFIALTNELLNRTSSLATSTVGTISSAVAHGKNYDQDSVSAGEDNAGQLVLAIMSFRKLKEEYSDYKGGLLLIDEADAGLFPAAQIKLIKILAKECADLKLQVIMTSHSPTLIEYAFEQSEKFRRKYKTVYLSNTYGNVQIMHDMSWSEINADIHTRTISVNSNVSLPKINIYFEDQEGIDFFKAIMFRQPINKYINLLGEITLGCSNYIQLVNKKVLEFSKRSIICLDADVDIDNNGKKYGSIILLPGILPPDQLIFEYLYNLPSSHPLWKNPMKFSRSVFTDTSSRLINALSITDDNVDIKKQILAYQADGRGKSKKPREMFKEFYNTSEFQLFINQHSAERNPWKNWVKDNKEQCDVFICDFIKRLRKVMCEGHYVEADKLFELKKRGA